ncbi:UDP-GalNAc:beta-1,3-N-acetylgalactosaminyltransferase 2-like [Babylonia areolata]|uniref:UDP-GalNAc:beta-1, 3-N-acetylgalactosaminyltransferase 2-like n=1 Tax=Babylonia areolata TaxID=304850 RepID=UPI003FD04BBC
MFSPTRGLCALFVVLLAIIGSLLQFYDKGREKREILLGVCVLSARDHQEQRTAIRNTWLAADAGSDGDQEESSNRTVVRFVVGRDGCLVPPEDRVDQYGCQEWTPNITSDVNKDFEAFTTVEKGTMAGPKVSQLSVRVMHPVVLKRIGILASIPLTEEALVVSAFRDFDEEELASVQFSAKDQGVAHGGYRYQPVEPVLLTKVGPFFISPVRANRRVWFRIIRNRRVWFRIIRNRRGQMDVVGDPQGQMDVVGDPQGQMDVVGDPQGQMDVVHDPQGQMDVVGDPQGQMDVVRDPQEREREQSGILWTGNGTAGAGTACSRRLYDVGKVIEFVENTY